MKEAVEKIIEAKQGAKDLQVKWAHTGDGREHNFTVEDVARTTAPSEVSLEINGKEIQVDRTSETRVTIPKLGDFRIMNVRVDQGSDQHVVIQFSDPLAARQSL